MASNEKDPVLNRDNLKIPIPIQLSQKQKNFSEFFASFLKSRLNFRDFEYKDGPHRICIFEVTDSQNILRWMSKKYRFRGSYDKQDGVQVSKCPSTVVICIVAPLSYSLVTGNEIVFEKLSLH